MTTTKQNKTLSLSICDMSDLRFSGKKELLKIK